MLELKGFKDTAQSLADLLNWSALIDDGVVQCKDGSLMAGWFYRGHDLASSTDSQRNFIAEHVGIAFSRLGGGWAVWVDNTRVQSAEYPDPERSHFPDPISQLVDDERRERFTREGLHFESEYTIIISYMPPDRRASKFAALLAREEKGTRRMSPADRAVLTFRKGLRRFEDSIGDAVRLRRMRSYLWPDMTGREHMRDELVNALQFALTGRAVALNIPDWGAYLDTFVGGQPLEAKEGQLHKLGGKYVQCVAIEGFPAESAPNILAALDSLEIAYRWSSRTIFVDQPEALKALDALYRKWKQKQKGFFAQLFKTKNPVINEDAVEMTGQAAAALSDAHSALVKHGYYSSVVVLMNEDLDQLAEDASEVFKEIENQGFAARIETARLNNLDAWMGTLPGHPVPNLRRPPIHTGNLADLLPLAGVWMGLDYNPCPPPTYPAGSPPLLHAATTGATPFRLNLYCDDVGHTLIFGPTGAGKSTLLATVCMQALRYAGISIWAFDYKMGLFATVKACRGKHYEINGSSTSPQFCPLGVLDDHSDLQWAAEYVETLFNLQTGKDPTPAQRQAIFRAVELLQKDTERTITNLQALIQDAEVRGALQYYTVTGYTGELLDARRDTTAPSHFTVFETEDLFAMGDRAAIPVLLYLFRRFEKSLTGQPALLFLDEAWVMMGHRVFEPKLRMWLKTLRSKGCAVVISTQSLSDADRSGLLDVLLESCPTKIYLANDEAETDASSGFYRKVGLNEAQIALIARMQRKRHYYVVQPEGRRQFDLGLERDSAALAFAGSNSKPAIARIRELERLHGDRWPYVWMEEFRVGPVVQELLAAD